MLYLSQRGDTQPRARHLDRGRIYRGLWYGGGNNFAVLFGTPNEMPHNTRFHYDDREKHEALIGAVVTSDNYRYYLINANGVLIRTEADYLAQDHITAEDLSLTNPGPRGLLT